MLDEAYKRLQIRKAEEAQQEPEMPVKIAGSTSSVNGCGTMVCEARGVVPWVRYPEDCDAILAFCIVGIPLVPYAAIHTSNWEYHQPKVGLPGWRYKAIPIKWSWELVASAYIVRMWVAMVAGGILLVFLGYVGVAEAFSVTDAQAEAWRWIDQMPYRLVLPALGSGLVALGVFYRRQWGIADRRHQAIRLVLGRHVLGNSDPVFWRDDLHLLVRPASDVFGTATFGEAATQLLSQQRFVPAMFAARLCAARESRQLGEELTAAILDHPQVQAALEALHREPKQRLQVLPSADWRPLVLFVG